MVSPNRETLEVVGRIAGDALVALVALFVSVGGALALLIALT